MDNINANRAVRLSDGSKVGGSLTLDSSAQGALQGAQAGAAFGPFGAVVGGGLGGLLSILQEQRMNGDISADDYRNVQLQAALQNALQQQQNEWNSYSADRQRAEAAGLNYALLRYGGNPSSLSSGSVAMPQLNLPNSASRMQAQAAADNVKLQRAQGFLSVAGQLAQIVSSIRKNNAEIDNIRAQTDTTETSNKYLEEYLNSRNTLQHWSAINEQQRQMQLEWQRWYDDNVTALRNYGVHYYDWGDKGYKGEKAIENLFANAKLRNLHFTNQLLNTQNQQALFDLLGGRDMLPRTRFNMAKLLRDPESSMEQIYQEMENGIRYQQGNQISRDGFQLIGSALGSFVPALKAAQKITPVYNTFMGHQVNGDFWSQDTNYWSRGSKKYFKFK